MNIVRALLAFILFPSYAETDKIYASAYYAQSHKSGQENTAKHGCPSYIMKS
ncbi:hypothetical protein QVD99_006631 [Batrachochytrium dendrobatidis]|nr:hypothetical protein O5D80_005387 [Batrachochytrium dendrobatidis]KAK5666556.1 hypothetical protein QVD99_006631 [Batrachochytrium dendrobatidis]